MLENKLAQEFGLVKEEGVDVGFAWFVCGGRIGFGGGMGYEKSLVGVVGLVGDKDGRLLEAFEFSLWAEKGVGYFEKGGCNKCKGGLVL